MRIRLVGYVYPTSRQNGGVYDSDGLAPCLSCGAHHGVEPKIRITYESG